MHELALTQSVIELVTERARQEGLRCVTRVTLEVGAFVPVDAAAIRFCFDAAAADTEVAGAELVIVPIPLRARCKRCACEHSPATLISPCPQCGGGERDWLAGREARVLSFQGQ